LRSGLLLVPFVVLVAACSPQRDSTPLPTKQTTIDPVMKKLDAASEQAEKRREEMEAASK
jgi:nitrogenase subunit NifH